MRKHLRYDAIYFVRQKQQQGKTQGCTAHTDDPDHGRALSGEDILILHRGTGKQVSPLLSLEEDIIFNALECLQKEEGNLIFTILVNKQVCPLTCRKTLILASKAFCNGNHLENVVYLP